MAPHPQPPEIISFILLKKFCTRKFAVYSMTKLCAIPRRYSMMSMLLQSFTVVRRRWSASIYSRLFTGPGKTRTYCSYATSLPFRMRRRPSINLQIEEWTMSSSVFRRFPLHPRREWNCDGNSIGSRARCFVSTLILATSIPASSLPWVWCPSRFTMTSFTSVWSRHWQPRITHLQNLLALLAEKREKWTWIQHLWVSSCLGKFLCSPCIIKKLSNVKTLLLQRQWQVVSADVIGELKRLYHQSYLKCGS